MINVDIGVNQQSHIFKGYSKKVIRFKLHSDGQQSWEPACFYPSSGLICIPGDPDDYNKSSYIHEVIHLCQVIGTPFGRFLTNGLIFREMAIISAVSTLASLNDRIIIDLRQWRDSLDDRHSTIDRENPVVKVLNRTIGLCDRIERALGNLVGHSTSYNPFYGHLQGMSIRGSHFPALRQPSTSVVPQVTIKNRSYRIHGASLLEASAWFWAFLDKQCRFGDIDLSEILVTLAIAWRDNVEFETYFLPIAFAYERLGMSGLCWFPMIADLSLRGPTPEWSSLSTTEHRIYTPDGEGGYSISGDPEEYEFEWEEVSPGWRFLNIIELLQDSPQLCPEFSGKHVVEFYPLDGDIDEFVDQIPKILGWSDPREQIITLSQVEENSEIASTFPKMYQKLDSKYTGLPGLTAFPLIHHWIFEEAGMLPVPALFIGDSFLATDLSDGLLSMHFRTLLTAEILQPLGVSWALRPDSMDLCPFTRFPLEMFCHYEHKKEHCEKHKFPKTSCEFRRSTSAQLGFDIENYVLYG